jgi:hypothetical protein
MERMTLIVPRSKSISPHFKPNISLCRNPVDAAKKDQCAFSKCQTID